MDTIDELNDQEKEAVNEIRKRMETEMELEMLNDVYFLRRFLKARDFNVEAAEIMLRKHLQWRKKNDIKNILQYKKPEVLEKYVPYVTVGYDKEGCVVRYFAVGNMDIQGIWSSVSSEDILKTAVYETERDTEELRKQSKKLGRNIDKCVYIYNFANFTLAKATDKRVIHDIVYTMNWYVNNYPERLKKAFVLNASIYFHIVFSALKAIFPKTILDKIEIYSDEFYKEDLLKVIEADVLPAFLGGNRTDSDGNPLCLSFVKHGELVPPSYYLQKCKKSIVGERGVEKINLSRAAFHEVTINVEEPGSYIEWQFETKSRDIGFGLFYQELTGGKEKSYEILPIHRIDSEIHPETGTLKCEKAGTFSDVLVFDNTYSWVREKQIYYRLKVVPTKEHVQDMDKTNR